MAKINIRKRPDSVMEWTLEDVVDWLKQLKLDKYCKRFQSHLVSGPVLLQMDDILLDDLNITFSEERELILKESRKLCLEELDIVNQALKQKQKSKGISTELDKSALESMAFDGNIDLDGRVAEPQPTQEKPTQQNSNPQEQQQNTRHIRPSSNADEVASRATEMVAMLSQENADLRNKMEEYLQDRYELQMMREQVAKLQTENNNLVNQVARYNEDNVKLVSSINQLRCDYQKLEDTLKQQKTDRQQYEDQVETLKRDNRSLRDKYQRLKYKTVEREMSRSVSNINPQGISSELRYPDKNSPRLNGITANTNGKTPTSLQLIEKVYQANKRCAELEDTVRWMSRLLVMENNRDLHNENQLVCDDSCDYDGPCEPDWPSLTVTRTPTHNSKMNDNNITPDVLQRLISKGLPTDNDNDIWRTKDVADAVFINQRDTIYKYYRTSNA